MRNMPARPPTLFPSEEKLLQGLGTRLRLARQRRRMSMVIVSERAGISRITLHRIERGDPAVTVGNYLRVLVVLGLERDLELLAKDDELGRRLQDLELTPRRASH